MKKSLMSLFFAFSITSVTIAQVKISDPVDFVNPLMGTDSKPNLSNGNTYPAIAFPWGMNVWTPQTGRMGDGWAYQYNSNKINGFKETHQPSPWMNDYGAFAIMPVTGKIRFNEDNGQTSAWYVFSALGFYPVTPASVQYVAGAPLFKHAEIDFENGHKLFLNAYSNSDKNRYISSVTFNGKEYTKNYFNHFDLERGGEIKIGMKAKPNMQRGTKPEDSPYSFSK